MEETGMGYQFMPRQADSSQLKFDVYDSWPIPSPQPPSVFHRSLPAGHIWTNTKANLIRNYLRYFQWVTKHGCYIDGFSGPQYESEHESWAAKLVLEMEPKWFRNFFLCELSQKSFDALKAMVSDQENVAKRDIRLHQGDFNTWIDEVLDSGVVTDSMATFALLDQRTAECKWKTVEKLALHKKGKTKIELFYFFPTGWISRAISSKNNADLQAWWGGEDWKELKGKNQTQSIELMISRFRSLGYLDVYPWPIHKRDDGEGRIMYHMIHATDHPQAHALMMRAYRKLVATPEEIKTIDMWEQENLKMPASSACF